MPKTQEAPHNFLFHSSEKKLTSTLGMDSSLTASSSSSSHSRSSFDLYSSGHEDDAADIFPPTLYSAGHDNSSDVAHDDPTPDSKLGRATAADPQQPVHPLSSPQPSHHGLGAEYTLSEKKNQLHEDGKQKPSIAQSGPQMFLPSPILMWPPPVFQAQLAYAALHQQVFAPHFSKQLHTNVSMAVPQQIIRPVQLDWKKHEHYFRGTREQAEEFLKLQSQQQFFFRECGTDSAAAFVYTYVRIGDGQCCHRKIYEFKNQMIVDGIGLAPDRGSCTVFTTFDQLINAVAAKDKAWWENQARPTKNRI